MRLGQYSTRIYEGFCDLILKIHRGTSKGVIEVLIGEVKICIEGFKQIISKEEYVYISITVPDQYIVLLSI